MQSVKSGQYSTKAKQSIEEGSPFILSQIHNTPAECVYLPEHPPAEGAVRTFHRGILTFILMFTAHERKYTVLQKIIIASNQGSPRNLLPYGAYYNRQVRNALSTTAVEMLSEPG